MKAILFLVFMLATICANGIEVSKVVIPAAGLGTRFLPFTKAVPKEMLPLLNKPAIQYIVEESLVSQLNNVCFITSSGKEAIANYFDFDPRLDSYLETRGKEFLVSDLKKILNGVNFSYVRQMEPLGLGHAVMMAKEFVGKEYFGIILPDDIITTDDPAIGQLARIAKQENASVIAVQEVPKNLVSNYGVISVKNQISEDLFEISNLVEKPAVEDAPSNLAIVGRYVLSYKVMDILERQEGYSYGKELQLTDAIDQMLQAGEKVFAYKVKGTRHDIGVPLGWLKANIAIAMADPDYEAQL